MAERDWSLTRHLARRFALMTSALLALYAVGSAYVLHAALRDDVDDFLVHETSEFSKLLEDSDGSEAMVRRITEQIALIGEPMPCAFRVRDAQGYVLAEAGPDSLLDAPEVHDIDQPGIHRPWLLGTPVFSRSAQVPQRGFLVEVIVDAQDNQQALFKYVVSAGTSLLLFVGLAAMAAWFTAWRGLRSLRELTAQARRIESAQRGASLRLHDAPLELRELGGELNAMLERIEDGLQSMKTFTAGLAHELRSPLQNLLGEIEVALLSLRTPPDYERLLRSNLDDLHALSDAVDNLIAWCRSAEPRRRSPPLETFDLAEEARLRLERERRTAERSGIVLQLASSGDTRLLANREDSLRVLRNLVGNALAWSPGGAPVDVRIDGDERGVRVSVDDRGPGIPPELAARIFDPFVTGRPRKGARGGYGLGLAICRAIMQEHKGSLSFEAREGGGTRFIAHFPRPDQRAA
jgi:two-component system heavy metal sensor histidine kinase CusS